MTKELCATTAKYGGSGIAVFFGCLGIEEWAAVVGAIVAVAGFIMSWWYKHQALKLMKKQAGLLP